MMRWCGCVFCVAMSVTRPSLNVCGESLHLMPDALRVSLPDAVRAALSHCEMHRSRQQRCVTDVRQARPPTTSVATSLTPAFRAHRCWLAVKVRPPCRFSSPVSSATGNFGAKYPPHSRSPLPDWLVICDHSKTCERRGLFPGFSNSCAGELDCAVPWRRQFAPAHILWKTFLAWQP